MIEHPRAEELLEAVAAWIDEVRPGLNPREAFLGRVAANAINLVRRELLLGPASEAAASQRLSTLLGVEGDLDALNAQLCERMKEGTMDVSTPGLLAILRANVEEQIAIDQPAYVADGQG